MVLQAPHLDRASSRNGRRASASSVQIQCHSPNELFRKLVRPGTQPSTAGPNSLQPPISKRLYRSGRAAGLFEATYEPQATSTAVKADDRERSRSQ
jgi:hypothetical protein